MNILSNGFERHTSGALTDGNQIEVESTSAKTASVSPVVISKSDTDVTRIVFEPTLVDNSNDSEKCISGKMIYEKETKGMPTRQRRLHGDVLKPVKPWSSHLIRRRYSIYFSA